MIYDRVLPPYFSVTPSPHILYAENFTNIMKIILIAVSVFVCSHSLARVGEKITSDVQADYLYYLRPPPSCHQCKCVVVIPDPGGHGDIVTQFHASCVFYFKNKYCKTSAVRSEEEEKLPVWKHFRAALLKSAKRACGLLDLARV